MSPWVFAAAAAFSFSRFFLLLFDFFLAFFDTDEAADADPSSDAAAESPE